MEKSKSFTRFFEMCIRYRSACLKQVELEHSPPQSTPNSRPQSTIPPATSEDNISELAIQPADEPAAVTTPWVPIGDASTHHQSTISQDSVISTPSIASTITLPDFAQDSASVIARISAVPVLAEHPDAEYEPQDEATALRDPLAFPPIAALGHRRSISHEALVSRSDDAVPPPLPAYPSPHGMHSHEATVLAEADLNSESAAVSESANEPSITEETVAS